MKTSLKTLLFLLFLFIFYLTYYYCINFDKYNISPPKLLNVSKRRKPIYPDAWMVLSNYEIFAFSAYWDLRIMDKPVIRILMWRKHEKHHEAECVVELTDGTSISLPGDFVKDYHVYGYEAVFWDQYFECPTSNLTSEPYAVALQLGNETSAFLEVKKVENSEEKQNFLTICTQPLFNFYDWFRLIFFVEYYKSIGVDSIIFYKNSVTEDVERVLQFYIQSGMVQTVSMPQLPRRSSVTKGVQKADWWTAQLARMGTSWLGQPIQIADCIFRSIGVTKFWTDVDVDEFIGNPAGTKPNFLNDLLADVSPEIGGIQIQSGFWNGDWPKSLSINNFDLSTLKWLQIFSPFRVSELFPARNRSKVIVRPEAIYNKIVHEVYKYMPGFSEMVMSPNKAVVYHLRHEDTNANMKMSNPFQNLSSLVLDKIEKVVKELKNY